MAEPVAHNGARLTSHGNHFSCSLTVALLARVDDFGGADAVEQTLRLARSTRALPYLLDTGNWISYDEAVALWDAGRRVTHHPQFARAVGEDATRRLRTSPVADLLRSLGSPEAVYRQMAIASARFSTVSTFETVTAGPGCAEIRSLPVDGFPRHPDHCAWTCGLLTTTPPLFGLAPALVEHNECVSYGAASCLYRITWNVAEEPANGDSTGQISALRDQLDAMRERLRNMFETASDLIGPDELTDVLARITDRAAVEVRAPRYLLAVRATPEGEMHRHHKGFEPHEAAAHADRILSEDPAGLPASWLVVPIASHRRDYGRLLAMNDDGRPFFPQERELLEVYARYAASALDSATALMEARQLREAELSSSERFISAITDSMTEGMFALDGEGRVTYMNRAAVELLGWSEAELIGQPMHELTHSQHADGSVFPVEDCPLTSLRVGRPDIRVDDDVFTHKSGGLIPVAYSAAPLAGSRGLVVVFSDISLRKAQDEHRRRELESLHWVGRIRDALDEHRLVLYAQPVIELPSRRQVTQELLLRMIDRDGTVIGPGQLLPVAERFGLIGEIDRWVVAQAVELAASGVSVHFNLSGQSLSDRDLVPEIARLLSDSRADPQLLVCEITETAIAADQPVAEAFVHQLAALGVRIALDDFGTGFGGLTYLKRLPCEQLKIDVEFVSDLTVNPESQHVVKAIVNLAQGFGRKTVAEGVENEETLELLEQLSVDYAQGFWIGRPKPLVPVDPDAELDRHSARVGVPRPELEGVGQ